MNMLTKHKQTKTIQQKTHTTNWKCNMHITITLKEQYKGKTLKVTNICQYMPTQLEVFKNELEKKKEKKKGACEMKDTN